MKTLMILIASALTTVAFAENPAPQRGNMKGRFNGMGGAMGTGGDPVLRIATNPMLAEKIGLNDEQKAKLKEVTGDSAQMRAMQKKISEGMKRQAELLKAEKIDEAAVMSAIDEVFETRKEIAKNQTKQLIAVRSILTPEQIEKAKSAAAELRNRRGNGPRKESPRKEGPREKKPARD